MFYYTFKQNDTFYNRIETHPYVQFYINDSKVYYNNKQERGGHFASNVKHIPVGSISLYELNIDRPADSLIYPFITKGGSRTAFRTISTNTFNQFQYGDIITGSYPLSSSIIRSASIASGPRKEIKALKNTLNYYRPVSPLYAYSSSLGGDKSTQALTLISIPSIFYDSGIKKSSVKLSFYISGTLVAACEDINRNGELVQTSGSVYAQANGSGSVAGMVLYKEGFVILTGSWGLTKETFQFGDASATEGTWLDFAIGANDGESPITNSASFSMDFKGTNYINVITMLADAPVGELNYSANPTFVQYQDSQPSASTSNIGYFQNEHKTLKNTISSSFYNFDENFKRQTFISKIGIYDENKNLIATANLAKPIKKTEDRDFTFKLKLDI